jgi:hypothetical protein
LAATGSKIPKVVPLPLRLPELLLEPLALAHVAGDELGPDVRAVLLDPAEADFERDRAVVAGDQLALPRGRVRERQVGLRAGCQSSRLSLGALAELLLRAPALLFDPVVHAHPAPCEQEGQQDEQHGEEREGREAEPERRCGDGLRGGDDVPVVRVPDVRAQPLVRGARLSDVEDAAGCSGGDDCRETMVVRPSQMCPTPLRQSARAPRTTRAFSAPARSMKQASPMLPGKSSSR